MWLVDTEEPKCFDDRLGPETGVKVGSWQVAMSFFCWRTQALAETLVYLAHSAFAGLLRVP